MPISSELRFGMNSSATLAPTPPSQAPESHSSHLLPGVVDELELHVISVSFGQGRRLFDGLASEYIELERTRILEERAVSPICTTGSAAEVSVPRPRFPGLG